MKACFMKVNYDQKYVNPNKQTNGVRQILTTSRPAEDSNLKAYYHAQGQSRLKAARNVYSCPEKKAHEQLQMRAREQLKQTLNDMKAGVAETELNTSSHNSTDRQAHQSHPRILSSYAPGNVRSEIVDLRTGTQLPKNRKEMTSSGSILRPLHSKDQQSLSHSAVQQAGKPVLSQRSVNVLHVNKSQPLTNDHKPPPVNTKHTTSTTCSVPLQRSKTTLAVTEPRPHGFIDLERQARNDAERAMKDKKVFTVSGPYPSLRAALRRRGWVEKINSASAITEATRLSANGERRRTHLDSTVVSMMSHYVRNCTPTLLFAVKATDVGSKVTKSTQLVNHFGKASTFTTKAGLSQNLRSVPWFKDVDPNTFYPRCYNLGDADEKAAFFDDYHLTACISLMKFFVTKYGRRYTDTAAVPSSDHRPSLLGNASSLLSISCKSTSAVVAEILHSSLPSTDSDSSNASPKQNVSRRTSVDENGNVSPNATDSSNVESATTESQPNNDNADKYYATRSSTAKNKRLSVKTLELAIDCCQKFISDLEHTDLDVHDQHEIMTRSQWEQYLDAYNLFVRNELEMERKAMSMLPQCRQMLHQMKLLRPQYELDGYHNVWIFKPGAKSRGRGIQCTNRYADISEAIASSDCSLVAQKYIERPFLIYNTKFDIRQWFLVTDWNPLTLWFYNACYLRFCSQEYTLDSFHISIHLSNNSVQKYFSLAPNRSDKLPVENMWASAEFEEFLRSEGHGEVWSSRIVPGMKQAITCVLLCTQDQVEHRKTAFELYGADFMLTEDLQPWLIEVNSSPSMARTTRVTADLVDCVLEDTVKVVLDRKNDKSCDTGLFELIYRQPPITDPPQLDSNLCVEGRKVNCSSSVLP